jgi:8-oxo-dGTP pyrophosphatase MutT (NUDIX family)
LTPEEIRKRLAKPRVRYTRRAPQSVEEDRPRGDHDLNSDFYDPDQPLTGAAVLVPIVQHAAAPPSVLLTRRTDHLRDHAGQISFPGGRMEESDSGPEAAALRETEEEIGLAPSRISIVGQLDTYITRTGFEVYPIVGLLDAPYELVLDSFEVAEAFEVPLVYFLDHGNREIHTRIWQGRERFFYVYPYQNYYIWGATAGMLSNLAEILAEE